MYIKYKFKKSNKFMETITIPINEYNELISFKKSILNITKRESKTQYEEVNNQEQKEIEKLHFDISKDKFDRSEYVEL